jgi:hypothetical protein
MFLNTRASRTSTLSFTFFNSSSLASGCCLHAAGGKKIALLTGAIPSFNP